ncbi:MAG: PilN domain-containing protein [Candidatus Kerfeldbacteria bacterium]|nr:PilN domain-containing protein [Candidatus Kerfeldbacteria bacterium]
MISLNLLPPERKQQLNRRATLHRWRAGMTLLLLTALFGNLVFALDLWWLQQEQRSVEQQLAHVRQQASGSGLNAINEQTRHLNLTVQSLQTTLPASRSWGLDLSRLLNALPRNVVVTELRQNVAGQIEIAGLARTRTDFIALDDALKNSPALTNVSTDSIANKREDLPFLYQAEWRPES